MEIKTLEEAIKLLSSDSLAMLTYAFDNGYSQVAFLPDGYFVAVHSNVLALETKGAWKFGQTPQKEETP
jgi:hypothetical protein